MMPVLQAWENGTFSTPQSHGWHVQINNKSTSQPGCVTVLRHPATNSQIVIMCPILEHGGEVEVFVLTPGELSLADAGYLGDGYSDYDMPIGELLTVIVNNLLKHLQETFEIRAEQEN